jgi:hypothetical protein
MIKGISKGYFFGAMAVSALHTVHSFEKLGLTNGEQWITPLAVDGLAFFALGLQSSKYSDSTNRIGLRLQISAGIAQLAANVFAASSVGAAPDEEGGDPGPGEPPQAAPEPREARRPGDRLGARESPLPPGVAGSPFGA